MKELFAVIVIKVTIRSEKPICGNDSIRIKVKSTAREFIESAAVKQIE